jgi:hypothetical protein
MLDFYGFFPVIYIVRVGSKSLLFIDIYIIYGILRLQFRGCVFAANIQPLCNWRYVDLLVLQKPGSQISAHRGCDELGRRTFHPSNDGFLVLFVCLSCPICTFKRREML